MAFQGTRNLLGNLPRISTSPIVRKIRSENAANEENPLALFLTMRITLFTPSATALVKPVSTKVRICSSYLRSG